MSSPNPGIVSTADVTRPGATYLPLESLDAHVYIADVSARVVLSQLYSNSGPEALKEAHYVFPVPSRAAVCSFEMRTDNGRRLKGIVKEITQAKAEYDEAVSQGRLAGLLQQFRRDVFAVCIGTIPPRTNVTVTLSYVIDLSEDDQHDTVRFYLPLHVAARYGAPPTSALYHGTDHRARVSITVQVEMASSITSVSSPSHAIQDITQSRSSQPITDDRYACVQCVLRDTFLTTDFLLVVQASGLDIPRCLAETLTSPSNGSNLSNGGPTTALALTIVPRFNLPTLPKQEYIFLVDRSGSMTGEGIQTAKEALGCLLRMLPSSSATKFNIFGFGSRCECLWSESQIYDNSTLLFADPEVNAMQANLGGTKLLPALVKVFSTRSHIMPTSVFVLTDGEIFRPDETIEYVRGVVSSAPHFAPLRLFTLGVGSGASTALCERLADAGNGKCVMAVQTEDLMLKSIRLVNAMRVSTVEALTVDWGVPGQALQAQDPIPTISPGIRTVVTAIVSSTAPTHVTLRGRLSDGNPLEYSVPVVPLSLRIPSIDTGSSWHRSEAPPLLHTLAAHRYIQGLDGGELQPYGRHFDGLSPATCRRVVKNLVVELGIQYQVASSRTAFIAVDTPVPRPTSPPPVSSSPGNTTSTGDPKSGGKTSAPDTSAQHKSSTSGADTFKTASEHTGRGSGRGTKTSSPKPSGKNSPLGTSPRHRSGTSGDGTFKTASDHTGRRSEGTTGQKSSSQAGQTSRRTAPSQSKLQRSPEPDQQVEFYSYDPPVDTAAEEVVVLPDPLGGNKPVIFTAPPLSRSSIFPQYLKKSFWSLMYRPADAIRQVASYAASVWPPVHQTDRDADITSTRILLDFSRSQAAEGSFSLTQELSSTIGISEGSLRSSIPSTLLSIDGGEQVWATAIAVAFFRSKHPRHKEVWETVEGKAIHFGSQALQDRGVSFEEIVRDALALLPSRRI